MSTARTRPENANAGAATAPPDLLGGRILVAVGLATSLPAALWLVWMTGGPAAPILYAVGPVLTAAPLLPTSLRWFQRLCFVNAILLVVLAVVGVFLGLYHFLPGAALLAMAPFAVVGRGRTRWFTYKVLAVGLLIGVGSIVDRSAQIYDDMLSPPDAFLVHVDTAAEWVRGYSPLLEYDGSGIGHGANHVSEIGTGDPKSTIVVVGFDQGMSAAARDALESRLHQLPGVQYVELCDRWAGEC